MSCKYNNCKICGYKSECEIYKENAELKDEIENDRDLPAIAYMQGAEKQKKKDEEQLTKAKEIIKSSIVLLTKPRTALDTKTYLMKAEDFIK